jgi:hypothetical protein
MKAVLRWIEGIVAAFGRPTEDISRPEACASETANQSATAISITTANPSAAEVSLIAPIPSAPAAPILPDAVTPTPSDAIAPVLSEPLEILRRRELVRTLFNDFWDGLAEKPAAFVDRLDQAEDYLNERLAASGERWQLDAKMRKFLGLPTRSNPRNAARPN